MVFTVNKYSFLPGMKMNIFCGYIICIFLKGVPRPCTRRGYRPVLWLILIILHKNKAITQNIRLNQGKLRQFNKKDKA